MALTQVKSDGIATGAVTATQIAANAVTVDDISDGSISTAKLADDAVTAAKLADTAVTAGTYGSSSAIPSITVDAQGRITAASTSSIDSTAITNGTSNVSVAASGDITATRAGTTRLTVNSTGIDVTGTTVTDGITNDGDIRFNSVGWTGDACKIQNFSNNLYIQAASSGIVFRRINGTDNARFTSDGHFLPNGNNTYDLGDTSNRWRNVYTNDLNLSNEGGANDVDGTWGSWTIQEGEDDLFLLNRRNGKKYKFNLSEVS